MPAVTGGQQLCLPEGARQDSRSLYSPPLNRNFTKTLMEWDGAFWGVGVVGETLPRLLVYMCSVSSVFMKTEALTLEILTFPLSLSVFPSYWLGPTCPVGVGLSLLLPVFFLKVETQKPQNPAGWFFPHC